MKFFNLTTSRTKQFCETSSKNGKLSADLTALCHFVLHFFPSHVSKVLRLPRKSDAKSYEVLHLSRKIISANLKIWCSKMQPLSGNQRLDLLTCLLEMSLVLPATRNAPLQILFKHLQTSHASSFFETVLYKTYRFVHFWQGAERIAPGKNDAMSKNGANVACLYHVAFKMCFATQWRSLFHTFSTSQLPKVLRTCNVVFLVFLAFWLPD